MRTEGMKGRGYEPGGVSDELKLGRGVVEGEGHVLGTECGRQ